MTLASVQGTNISRPGDEAIEESKDGGIPAQVQEARKYAIDSALVRIMKARKSLSHNELIAEAIHQLTNRFNASPYMLKMRIESLIERDYLRRDRDSPNVYIYMA